MYIKNICFNGSKVLGSVVIPMDSNSYNWNGTTLHGHEIKHNMTINMGKDKKNHYSFIIGDNGTGKSTLFRSIICFFYMNDTFENFSNSAAQYLVYQQEIWNPIDYSKNKGQSLREKWDNLRILHFSTRKTPISETPIAGFYENQLLEGNLSINMTKFLYQYGDKVDKLNQILSPGDNVLWTLHWAMKPLGVSKSNKFSEGYGMYFNGSSSINFIYLKDLVTYFSNSSDIDSLPNELKPIFEAIGKHSRGKSKEEILTVINVIKRTYIYNNLLSFLENNTKEYSKYCVEVTSENQKIWEQGTYPIDLLTEDDFSIIPMLIDLNIIEFDLMCNDVNVEDMSSGEQMMMRLFYSFAPIVREGNKNIIVLYDEPENSFHPKWQLEFPFIFRQVAEECFGITSSHFIFATHSPMIIMNATKLEKTKVSVLKFSRINKQFTSECISDVAKYSLEQIMMDHFDIHYRVENPKRLFEKKLNYDPMEQVLNSFEIKAKIDDLYKEILKSN